MVRVTLVPPNPSSMSVRTLSFAACFATMACAAQVNMSQLGHLDYDALHNSHLANIWGYTDELGNEYALVGVNGSGGNTGGLSVVDVSDPANPQEIAFIPGPTSDWREIKTWGDYAYVTTEASYGLTIVDLGPLPGSTTLPSTVFDGVTWNTSHSLFIDENGRLYLNGSDRGNGGVIMYDLTADPMAPVEVGDFDQWYCHDCFARGDTMYAEHINNGFFSIVDVSDPANPVLLGTQNTPNTFSHNAWLDESGQYLYTTDEVSGAFVGAYDVSDPGDIQFVDKLQSDPGSGTIPHNTYWLPTNHLVTSYYTFGAVIYDVSRPDNMVEVGSYDTSPFSGNGFNGAWGVYPFLPSGNLLVSDIEGGLYVLGTTYVSACWLEGTVTDQATTLPVNGATITILGTSIADATGLDGQYATGYHTGGTYDVLFTAPTYEPLTITGVSLTNGVVTNLDAELVPLVPFSFSGYVLESGTGDPIPDAQVRLTSTDYSYTAITDINGMFTIPTMYEADYDFAAGKWAWSTVCGNIGTISAGAPPHTANLDHGYADDFTFDMGWTVSGTATEGLWERAEPVGQSFSGFDLQTDVDITGDCTDQCYLTGNGPDLGTDDVQNGSTVLTSPVFDATGYVNPQLRWNYWYFDGALGGSVDDPLYFYLRTAGVDHLLMEVHPNANMSLWTEASYLISSTMTPAADMQFIVSCAKPVDIGTHILECAFDGFAVVEGVVGIDELSTQQGLQLWPNPGQGALELVVPGSQRAEVRITDPLGRPVAGPWAMTGERMRLATDLPAGTYFVSVNGQDGSLRTARWVVE